MNAIEKIARHVCTRMGCEPELEVSRYANHPALIGPMGHPVIPPPQFRVQAWELYAALVREVLLQARGEPMPILAIENEHVDPAATPVTLWQAGVDALIADEPPEPALLACDREDAGSDPPVAMVGEAVEQPSNWRKEKGLV